MSSNLVVGQAGGATAVINTSLVSIVREARESGRFRSVLGMRRGVEGALQSDFVALTHISDAGLSALAATPGAALSSSRHRLSDDAADRLLQILQQQDIHSFLYIGGNDSADTVHRLARIAADRAFELHAIAVPKTIDNDLPITDHSPGYGSIARYVAIATMDSAKDTESMPTMYPVKLIEVMGRNAGWVAAASALSKRSAADAPHLIYLPELPLSREKLLTDVESVYSELGHVLAVVAETVRDEAGRPFADSDSRGDVDAFGHALLRGTADSMCRLIQRELGLRARFDKPGGLQRMSMLCASRVDLEEAEAVGRAAVRLALAGMTDCMVTIVRDADEPYRSHTESADLAAVANVQRVMPAHYISQDRPGITDDFRSYALPLLGPDPLPHYARLDDVLGI